MSAYLIRRLIQIPIVLVGITLLTFLVVHLSPGDPAAIMAGPGSSPEDVANIRHQLGLDKSLPQQYLDYMGRILRGDFGRSLIRGVSVAEDLKYAFVNTFNLVVVARIWSLIVAIPLGVIAAVRQNSIWDRLCMAGSLLGLSLPTFWVGLILMSIFSLRLGWLPLSGMGESSMWTLDGLKYAILPAFTLGAPQVASLARLTRSTMLEVLRQDYIRTARAKGLSERIVIYKHALKNASLPITTIIGMQTGYMLAGTVVIESVFAWPGLGRLSVLSILARDFPLIQGTILVIALFFVLLNLAVDLTYSWLDPRIKY